MVETGRTEWLKNGAARGATVNDLTMVDERGIRVSLRTGSIGGEGIESKCLQLMPGHAVFCHWEACISVFGQEAN